MGGATHTRRVSRGDNAAGRPEPELTARQAKRRQLSGGPARQPSKFVNPGGNTAWSRVLRCQAALVGARARRLRGSWCRRVMLSRTLPQARTAPGGAVGVVAAAMGSPDAWAAARGGVTGAA